MIFYRPQRVGEKSAWSASLTATFGLTLCAALSLAGCATDGTTYGNTAGAPATGVYVIQNTTAASGTTSGNILQFSSTSTGAATPTSTLNGPAGSALDFLAVDQLGDLYTTSQSSASSSLLEYPVDSSASAQAVRSIPFSTATELSGVEGLAADPTGDLFVPENTGGVAVFSSAATGAVAPGGYILGDAQAGGGLSTLSAAKAAVTDANGNLYVIDSGNGVSNPIVVFSTAATGNVAPVRSIGGALTTMTADSPQAIATDSAGNLYVANVVAGVSSILVFDATATGNAPPLRTITGSSTMLGCVGGLAVDTEGGFIYVVSTPTCGSTASPSVLKFSTTGTGNLAPVSSFTSTAWTSPDPTLSIAVY
jgi:hypothetical protein